MGTSPQAKLSAETLSRYAMWPIQPEERAEQQERKNCSRNISLSEFADLLIFDGAVMASNQEPGVVARTGDHKASQDPSRGDISHESFLYLGQTDRVSCH